MTGWQPLRTVAGLTALRDAYGQNMSGLVPETGVYLADDGWWIALTGAPIPATTLHWSMGVMCGKHGRRCGTSARRATAHRCHARRGGSGCRDRPRGCRVGVRRFEFAARATEFSVSAGCRGADPGRWRPAFSTTTCGGCFRYRSRICDSGVSGGGPRPTK